MGKRKLKSRSKFEGHVTLRVRNCRIIYSNIPGQTVAEFLPLRSHPRQVFEFFENIGRSSRWTIWARTCFGVAAGSLALHTTPIWPKISNFNLCSQINSLHGGVIILIGAVFFENDAHFSNLKIGAIFNFSKNDYNES